MTTTSRPSGARSVGFKGVGEEKRKAALRGPAWLQRGLPAPPPPARHLNHKSFRVRGFRAARAEGFGSLQS